MIELMTERELRVEVGRLSAMLEAEQKLTAELQRRLETKPEQPAGGLTARQKQALDFIRSHIQANGGVSPSFDQIRVALDLGSKSGVHRLVEALEHRGFIARDKGHARTIKLQGGGANV